MTSRVTWRTTGGALDPGSALRRHRGRCGRSLDGGFEGVEGDAGVAADGGCEGFDGVVVHLDVEGAEAALGVGEGAADEGGDLLFVQGLEGEDAGAGEQRADDLEGWGFRWWRR